MEKDRPLSHFTTRSLAIAALVLAIISLIAAVVAIQTANDATDKVAGQDAKIKTLSAQVQKQYKTAPATAGSGTNNDSQSVGNQLPNGGGQ